MSQLSDLEQVSATIPKLGMSVSGVTLAEWLVGDGQNASSARLNCAYWKG